MNKKMKKLVEKILTKKCSMVSKDKYDNLYAEIYADYRDELCSTDIKRIREAEDPRSKFYEVVAECYADAEWNLYDSIANAVRGYLADEIDTCEEEIDEEELLDFIMETVYIKLPYDHFLKQEYYVNVCVDPGDGNYDYVSNTIHPHYNGREGEAIPDEASIYWLSKQQGYKKTDLKFKDGKHKDNTFLRSVYRELLNHGSHMAALYFLVRISLDELITINELIKLQDRNGHQYDTRKNPYCGYLVLDKNTVTGLFDPWSGGGSLFEISLEKDVKLPIKYIHSAMPDGEGPGYSIEDVYGMSGSAWKPNMVKVIHAPKKM
jgi:hypothetical protein